VGAPVGAPPGTPADLLELSRAAKEQSRRELLEALTRTARGTGDTAEQLTSDSVTRARASFFAGVLATALLATAAAQGAARPNVSIATASPHAGRIFMGVVMRVPAQVKVVSFSCKATIGGRLTGPRIGYRKYVGGTYIRPIIHKSFSDGRLVQATCGWRIPASAAAKLISLQQPHPGCREACGEWGFTVHFMDLTRRSGRGREQTAYYQGTTWKIQP